MQVCCKVFGAFASSYSGNKTFELLPRLVTFRGYLVPSVTDLSCFLSKLRDQSEQNPTRINCAYINETGTALGALSLLVVPCAKVSLKIERQIFIPVFIDFRLCFTGFTLN